MPFFPSTLKKGKNINEIIVQEALKDLGKTEVQGNQGWNDAQLELEMKMTGWELGQAWCAYWAEKVWTAAYETYEPVMVNVLRKLFSANAVATWENFKASRFVTSNRPVPGAVIIWQHMHDGKPSYVGDTTWIRGHAGIVREIKENNFRTFEGNSNQDGGREGIEVASLYRDYDFGKDKGLRLLGFIHPES